MSLKEFEKDGLLYIDHVEQKINVRKLQITEEGEDTWGWMVTTIYFSKDGKLLMLKLQVY